jgi:hypothetical protein
MFSTYAVQGNNTKAKGVYTREELAPLAQLNVESLKDFDYFTFAKADGKKQKLGDPIDYYLEYKDAALVLHFTLPFKNPIRSKQFTLEVFSRWMRNDDPTCDRWHGSCAEPWRAELSRQQQYHLRSNVCQQGHGGLSVRLLGFMPSKPMLHLDKRGLFFDIRLEEEMRGHVRLRARSKKQVCSQGEQECRPTLNRRDHLNPRFRHVNIPVNTHMTHSLTWSTRRPL